MVEKPWTTAFGKTAETLENPDILLGDKVSERRRNQIKREEEKDEAKHKADMAGYKKAETSAEAAVEKSGEKKEDTAGGYKITGGLNLGNINLQEERQAAMAETERLRKEAADSANRTAQENNQLRIDLHEAQMREIKATNAAAIELIRDKIDSRSPGEIIADIRKMAAELGLKAPDPGISDPSLSLQMVELQNAEAAREREFQWRMQKDREDREDRKEERKDERDYKVAQLTIQREKNDMFSKAPQVIGAAIASGMMANSGEPEAPSAPSQKSKAQVITAGIGESGEAECIKCHQPVAIGPTARKAVCAGCGMEYAIKRVRTESPGEPPEEEE